MRTVKVLTLIAIMGCVVITANVEAAFLVEAHDSGVASDNFDGTTAYQSIPSKAPGLSLWGTAAHSVFGASDSDNDWTYYYTPAIDVDNFNSSAGFDLSNNHVSSGLTGGAPGLYNVYITWPASDNPAPEGCRITISSDGEDIILDPVDMRNGGTGSPGGNNGWYQIGDQIHLTTGVTYTVNQFSNNPSHFPSQRSHGVLWELVEPDPQLATIVETDETTNIGEGGEDDTYTVVLNEQPPQAVVVVAQVLDPNQVFLNDQLNTVELEFTPGNWDIAQTVTASALDDFDVEGDHSAMVLHQTYYVDPNSADPNDMWTGAFAGLILVNITDNEIPDVRITESGGTTDVSEEGPTADGYTVKLLYPPTDNVTITIATDGQTQVDTGSGAGLNADLVFTSSDWDVEQIVDVIAVDDEDFEGVHTSTITHTVTSLDGGYDGLAVRNVIASVDDNECGAWGYLSMDFNRDCVVNLEDMAEFAASWLECTQPYGEDCIDLL